MRAHFSKIIAIAAAACAISCSKPGPLDNGSFSYECVSVPGAACASGQQSMPASLPVGAQFKLSYAASAPSTYPNVAVLPVSTDFFSVQSGVWTALLPGNPAVYATAGGLALDYAFIRIDGPTTASAR